MSSLDMKDARDCASLLVRLCPACSFNRGNLCTE